MNKSYRFRIYPNDTQRTMFAKTFGCHDRDTNAAINIRNEGMRIANALT